MHNKLDIVYIQDYFPKRLNIVKIKPKIRLCEIGSRINNPECNILAYRKFISRYGNKWTCDSCAREICLESEKNWIFEIEEIL